MVFSILPSLTMYSLESYVTGTLHIELLEDLCSPNTHTLLTKTTLSL